jgi:hypothetical protein
MSGHKLTDEQISHILNRAAEIDGRNGDLDRMVLERTASELGISPEAVQQAEAELRKSMTEEADRAAFSKAKWAEFYQHLASYATVNGFLFFLDFNKDHRVSWVWYPIFGWGIAMVLHLVSMFHGFHSDEVQKEFRKWQKARNKERKAGKV